MVRIVKTTGIREGKFCKIMFEWLQNLEYGRVVLKSDGEKSRLNIVEAVQMMRGRRDKDAILAQPRKGRAAHMEELSMATKKSE